jgi:hypothetical protein
MLRTLLTVSSSIVLMVGVRPAAFAEPRKDDQEARLVELQARVDRLEALVRTLTEDRARSLAAETLPPEPAALVDPPRESLGASAREEAPAAGSGLPQELLPSLGKIGASARLHAGAHSGPFGSRAGSYLGGSVELPLSRVPGGRLLYEFSAGLGRSNTPLRVTSNVAQVANLAVLANTVPAGGAANVEASLTGRPPAPFAVQYDVTSRMQVLRVVPFGLKYVSTRLDRYRVRPYAAAGLALEVTITNQETAQPASSPFDGALIGGQIAAAAELVDRGVPSGQGGIGLGLEVGGGIEWRAREGLSFGLDVRFNQMANGRSFVTATTRTGLHF